MKSKRILEIKKQKLKLKAKVYSLKKKIRKKKLKRKKVFFTQIERDELFAIDKESRRASIA